MLMILSLYNTDPVRLRNMLDMTDTWCKDNLLTVNCKKSQWMKTSIVQKHAVDLTFRLGNNNLEQVREYRYLGLLLDTDLSFNSLSEKLYKRVNLKICIFKKIRSYIQNNVIV